MHNNRGAPSLQPQVLGSDMHHLRSHSRPRRLPSPELTKRDVLQSNRRLIIFERCALSHSAGEAPQPAVQYSLCTVSKFQQSSPPLYSFLHYVRSEDPASRAGEPLNFRWAAISSDTGVEVLEELQQRAAMDGTIKEEDAGVPEERQPAVAPMEVRD